MSYNTKNYTEQGGAVTHFGGSVIFEEGCDIQGLPEYELEPATDDTLGGIKVGEGLSITEDGTLSADGITPAECQEDSTASTIANLKEDFNSLLAKLKAAGLMLEE